MRMADIVKSKTLPSWAVTIALSILSGLIARSLWQHDTELTTQRHYNSIMSDRVTVLEQDAKVRKDDIDELKRVIRELPFGEIRDEMRAIKSLIISSDKSNEKRLTEIEFQLKTKQ